MSSLLEYKGYHAKIIYDSEDDIFVGEVIWTNDLEYMEKGCPCF